MEKDQGFSQPDDRLDQTDRSDANWILRALSGIWNCKMSNIENVQCQNEKRMVQDPLTRMQIRIGVMGSANGQAEK